MNVIIADIYIEDDHNDIQVPDVDIPEPKVQEQEVGAT